MSFAAVIFDVDGVLVDSPHERAWRDALTDLMTGAWSPLRERSRWTPDGFTPQVYRSVLSGKPRAEGALACLEYFGVPGTADHVDEYAAHKQTLLERLIDERQFDAYPDAVRLVAAVRAAGLVTAAASSSKNAHRFLRAVRMEEFTSGSGPLLDAFDVDLSGRDFAHGKPDPEIFVTAADELAVPPSRCVVVEDAVSGIQAAKAGGMAALGVARAGDEDELRGAGADLVVSDLGIVDVAALGEGRLTRSGR